MHFYTFTNMSNLTLPKGNKGMRYLKSWLILCFLSKKVFKTIVAASSRPLLPQYFVPGDFQMAKILFVKNVYDQNLGDGVHAQNIGYNVHIQNFGYNVHN